MIQKNELRIGNYLLDEELTIIKIDESWEIDYANRYEPIELTDEILLKFNDISIINGYPYKMLNGYIKIRNGVFFFKYYDLEIDLPYLHTFQNLYFSLTGEELEINL